MMQNSKRMPRVVVLLLVLLVLLAAVREAIISAESLKCDATHTKKDVSDLVVRKLLTNSLSRGTACQDRKISLQLRAQQPRIRPWPLPSALLLHCLCC
jgi:hypothetical protein